MPVEPFWLSESAHYLSSVLSVPTIDTVYLFSLYSIYIETSVPIHPKSYTLPNPPPPPLPAHTICCRCLLYLQSIRELSHISHDLWAFNPQADNS